MTDNVTGLVWGGEPNCANEDCTWEVAEAYCQSIGTELPTLQQLFSLVDEDTATPGFLDGYYWSSQIYPGLSGFWWTACLGSGNEDALCGGSTSGYSDEDLPAPWVICVGTPNCIFDGEPCTPGGKECCRAGANCDVGTCD